MNSRRSVKLLKQLTGSDVILVLLLRTRRCRRDRRQTDNGTNVNGVSVIVRSINSVTPFDRNLSISAAKVVVFSVLKVQFTVSSCELPVGVHEQLEGQLTDLMTSLFTEKTPQDTVDINIISSSIFCYQGINTVVV